MPTSKLGIGLVGLGRWGSRLRRKLENIAPCHVAAVFDANPLKLLEEDASAACTSFEQLLGRRDVGAVIIATPNRLHHSMTLAALRAQKPVFVEKPMALSTVEARKIVIASRASGQGVMVGHVLQFHPALPLAAQLLQSGAIGDLVELACVRISRLLIEGESDSLWELGPHDFAAARYLVGEEPILVSALTKEMVVVAELAFATGTRATVTVGRERERAARKITIRGTKGTLVFDEEQSSLSHTLASGFTREWRFEFQPTTDPLSLELRRFVGSVLDTESWINDAVDGFAVVACLEAASLSRSLGSPVVPERVAAHELPLLFDSGAMAGLG